MLNKLFIFAVTLFLIFSLIASTHLWADSPFGSDTEKSNRERIEKKLNSIIFEKCNFDRLDLTIILPYLTKRSKELDPEHTGVNFVLRGPYQPPPFNSTHREMSLSLENLPLRKILEYLCQATDHDYKIENGIVVLFPLTKH